MLEFNNVIMPYTVSKLTANGHMNMKHAMIFGSFFLHAKDFAMSPEVDADAGEI